MSGINPPTPYTGTNTDLIEVNLLETYVDQLLGEIMPGGILAGASAFMPGDSIGSFQGGGIAAQVLQLIQQLLQQIATLETDAGSSQTPWTPFTSSSQDSTGGGSSVPAKAVGAKDVSGGGNGPPLVTASGSAGSAIGSYAGPTSSLSSYSGAGDTVAGGTLTPEDIDKQYGATIQADVDKYNKEYGTNLTKAFVEGIVYQESKGDPLATSTDGQDSKGLMQISTASGFDIGDILNPGGNQYDPNISLDSGIHLLAMMDVSGGLPAPLTGFYGTSDQGAGGNLALLASKFQGGPGTTTVNSYGTEVMGWATDFANGTPPPETY